MPTLFDQPVKTFTPFEIFDSENPQVWIEFKRIALGLIDRGVKHFGSKAIFEIIRYFRVMKTNDPDYKLNNNWTAHFARKFINIYPEYEGFFEVRERK